MSIKYSVSELNSKIKDVLKKNIETSIIITGEITNYKKQTSMYKHMYFDLKDDNSIINCIMWSNYVPQFYNVIEQGMKVEAKGKINYYEKGAKINIQIYDIKPLGVGNLKLEFDLLKNKLTEEGYFDEIHKKPVPRNANTIGIVSSYEGAGLQDIISVLSRRNPNVSIYVYDCKVQGVDCEKTIASGIEFLDNYNINNQNAAKLDVILVGRGGGSMEELWGFNKIEVVKAIYQANIPIVSCVGHEVDYTLCDFVADYRAITPSAAAEHVTNDYNVIKNNIDNNMNIINKLYDNLINNVKTQVNNLNISIISKNPKNQIENKDTSIKYNMKIINNNFENIFNNLRNKLDNTKLLFEQKNINTNLQNGFNYTFYIKNNKEKIIKNSSKFKKIRKNKDNKIFIKFSDGIVEL